MNIGLPEILMVLFVILIVFGPKRLPELSRAAGRSVGEFKRAMSEMQEQIESASMTPEEKPAEAQTEEEATPDEETAAAASEETGGEETAGTLPAPEESRPLEEPPPSQPT